MVCIIQRRGVDDEVIYTWPTRCGSVLAQLNTSKGVAVSQLEKSKTVDENDALDPEFSAIRDVSVRCQGPPFASLIDG